MRELTASELVDLGDRFGVAVDPVEADQLCEDVNDLLAELPAGPGSAVPDDRGEGGNGGNGTSTGEREWWVPEEDPHDAIAVSCSVPPLPDADDRLAGYEVGLKDIVAVQGVPMECGSAVMEGYVPATDATVVRRLRAAGASITAKTRLDEFAASGRGTTGASGPVTNPHDPSRTAGGSSGGSAVAVATDVVDVALGTDTGGSVRIPAAYCGVVGLKPTYGVVPMTGVVENSYTLDHVGPLARSVADCASVLEAIAGKTERDPSTLWAAGRDDYEVGGYAAAVSDPPDLAELRFGVLEEGMDEEVDPAVAEGTQSTLDRLADRGVTVDRVSVPAFDEARDVLKLLNVVELATHWRAGGAQYRRDGHVDPRYQAALSRRTASNGDLGEFYRTALLAGARVVDAHGGRPYVKATARRAGIGADLDDALADVDVLVTPTMAEVAPPVDAATEDDIGHGFGYNTRPANLTRHPAISLPNGTADGLPIGLQLLGSVFADADLLGVAAAVEDLLSVPDVPT